MAAANLPERLENRLGWSGLGYVVLAAASEAVDDRSVAQALDGAAIGFALAGIVVAAAQVPAGLSVASSGAFSPDGLVPIVAFVLFLAWIAASSVALTRAR